LLVYGGIIVVVVELLLLLLVFITFLDIVTGVEFIFVLLFVLPVVVN